MTCIEIQGLITPFINDELDVGTLEEFLAHMDHCVACKEELDVYNTLLTGMRMLDEDRSISSNFDIDLEMKLQRAEERIINNKISLFKKRTILLLLILTIGIFTNIGIEEIIDQDPIVYEQNVEKRRLMLNSYFADNKKQYLSYIYMEKLEEIMYDINEKNEDDSNPLIRGKVGRKYN